MAHNYSAELPKRNLRTGPHLKDHAHVIYKNEVIAIAKDIETAELIAEALNKESKK